MIFLLILQILALLATVGMFHQLCVTRKHYQQLKSWNEAHYCKQYHEMRQLMDAAVEAKKRWEETE